MTRWPVDPLTFSKKNPSRANGKSTYIHPPSLAKISQRTLEEIGNTPNVARIIVWLGNITHRGSNSEVHLHTPQQKVLFSLIRCSSSNAKGAYCSCVAWGLRIYNIVESESDPSTRWPFRKRTPQGQFWGPPTYTHQVWRRSVNGPRRR